MIIYKDTVTENETEKRNTSSRQGDILSYKPYYYILYYFYVLLFVSCYCMNARGINVRYCFTRFDRCCFIVLNMRRRDRIE